MSHLITALVLTIALRSTQQEVDPEAVLARYEKECPAGPASASCKAQLLQVEGVLYANLLRQEQLSQRLDVDTLKVAAAAESPRLRAFGLEHLASRGELDAEGKQLVLAAIDSPYRVVREAAQTAARRLGDEKLTSGFQRALGQEGDPRSPLERETIPTAEELGVQLYPGATYRFFASGPNRAFFTTADAPAKVLAFFTKGGKKVLTSEQIEAAQQQASQPDQRKMMAMMNNPRAMMELSQRMQENAGAAFNWTGGVKEQEGIESPRYVVMEEKELMGGMAPSRVVIVWKDTLLGATVIAVPRPSTRRPVPSPMGDRKAYERYMETLQLMSLIR